MAALNDPVPLSQRSTSVVPGLTGADAAAIRADLDRTLAGSSATAYRRDWDAFVQWCDTRGLHPLPASPDLVAGYLAHLGQATYRRRVRRPGREGRGTRVPLRDADHPPPRRRAAAIASSHNRGGYANPLNHPVPRRQLRGLARRGLAAEDVYGQQKRALLTADLRRLLACIPADGLRGARDRCLLLLGYAGGRRRGELATLGVRDVLDEGDQLRIVVHRSKNNQPGAREEYVIRQGSKADTDPVRAFRRWTAELAAALGVGVGDLSGPLFRPVTRHGRLGSPGRTDPHTGLTDHAIARIVKTYAARAGMSHIHYSAHSLRRGFVTQALRNSVPIHKIREASGHASLTSLQRYVAATERDIDPASGHLGL